MNNTTIEWADFSWNPFSGCEKVSAGCGFCYAETLAKRFEGQPAFPNGFRLTMRPHKFKEPLKLKKPSRIFVNSMSDFFWDQVTDQVRDELLGTMWSAPQHQFLILTKRPEAMVRYWATRTVPPHVWCGVSIETQDWAHRADYLRQVDARIRFISAEPLLSPLTLNLEGIHWLIAGGESGKHLRNPKLAKRSLVIKVDGKWVPRVEAMNLMRDLKHQCEAAGTAFFLKQWGGPEKKAVPPLLDGDRHMNYPQYDVRQPELEL